MANRVNNWRELLDLANKDLKKYDAEIAADMCEDGSFDISIAYDGYTDNYASGYYEDELGDIINDAWAHARAKQKHNVEKLVEAYFELTDAEKDEFLRLTENQ